MATGRIYNAFGQYETRDGEKGITLHYAGVPFWLPWQKVTTIPNFTFREVDHDKSTPSNGEAGELIYMSLPIPGERVVEELCMKQIPIPNRDMGILPIEGKSTGKSINVHAGWSANGQKLMSEVVEHEATRSEIAEAERLTKEYKNAMVQDYFQSKRDRMTGGQGKNRPDAITRRYMEELNIEDLDDVTAHAKNAGLNPDLLALILREVGKANSEYIADNIVTAVETIRKSQKAQLSPSQAGRRRTSMGLDKNKAEYEAREAAKEKEMVNKE